MSFPSLIPPFFAVMLTVPAASNWVKVNVRQEGYYRVNYDLELWDDLIQLLRTNHEVSRGHGSGKIHLP